MQISTSSLQKLDKIGATLSLICAIHCMFQPILLIFLPIVGLGFIADPFYETVFITGTVILASIALFFGFNHHGETKIFSLLGLGIILILLSRFIEPEPLFAVSGAISITIAHIWNLSLRTHSADDGHNHGLIIESPSNDIQVKELSLN